MDSFLPASGPDPDLATDYAYPVDLSAPHVRVNFVSTADGAATVDGTSGSLGSDDDRRLFGVLRELADVVLVGAGTARKENYRGARKPTRGRDAPPPIAVVTGSADLDPASLLFTDTTTPTIVLTTAKADAARRDALTAAGADVVTLGSTSPDDLLAELGRRGLHRVLCEGGPSLFGAFLAADAVDELCLTLAPTLAGGDAGRIATGPGDTKAQPFSLVGVLHAEGTLLLRYLRSGGRP